MGRLRAAVPASLPGGSFFNGAVLLINRAALSLCRYTSKRTQDEGVNNDKQTGSLGLPPPVTHMDTKRARVRESDGVYQSGEGREAVVYEW